MKVGLGGHAAGQCALVPRLSRFRRTLSPDRPFARSSRRRSTPPPTPGPNPGGGVRRFVAASREERAAKTAGERASPQHHIAKERVTLEGGLSRGHQI